ncbi:MAG: sulfatase [Candidatus Hydrogenedentota bacterium]
MSRNDYSNRITRRDFGKTSIAVGAAALMARSAAGSETKRPNILFALADDISYPHASAYGCPWVNTPAFDRVAEQGILFTNGYVPNPKCAPARASALTGRNSWQLEEAANHWCYFPSKFKVYPEALVENGYHVGYTGKGWGPGQAHDAEGDPRQLTGQPYNGQRAEPPSTGMSNIDYAANFEEFLEEKPTDTPFCFWYGAYEPHRGYEYRSGIEKGGKDLSDIDEVPAFWPDTEEVRTDMLDYAFEVEHFDTHLGRMLDLLEQRGELDNTLVVVTSDNGMPFPRMKGQILEYGCHMLLAIMWPARLANPGRTVDDYVSFIDFAPTFIEAAGLEWENTGMEPSAGSSLLGILESGQDGQVEPERDGLLVGKERHDVGRPLDWGYPARGIVRDGMLYVRNFEPDRWPGGNPETGYLNCDGSPTKTAVLETCWDPEAHHYWRLNFGKRPAEQLFDVRKDPDCVSDLADDPEYGELKADLKEQLYASLKEQGDPRMFGQGHVFDQYPYANEGQRDFYRKYMDGEAPGTGWVNDSDFDEDKRPYW